MNETIAPQTPETVSLNVTAAPYNHSEAKATGKKPKAGKRKKPIEVQRGNVVVKIYKRESTRTLKDGIEKEYTAFEVADYTTGTRRFQSFSDRAKAVKEAERIADQISNGKTTAASMLNSEAATFGRLVELVRPTGASLEYAAATFAKIWELVGDRGIEAAQFFHRHGAGQITSRTVPEVVTELIEAKKARGKSARYTKDLKNRLDRFAKSFAVDIGSVTTGDVQRWLDGLKLAPQSAKNFRTVVGTLFGFAEARGYVFKGGNPVDSTEQISANGGAIEIFTPKEILALLKHAPKNFVPVLAIGAFAGLRAAEVERLEWKDIDLAGGFIHISADNAKTRSRRLVPILPNLAEWLKGYAKKKGKVWKWHANDLRDVRAATVEAAGVPWKDNGLRHSFISYRLADIQNAAQAALEAGNSPAMVFKHYRELVKPDAAKTWFAITPKTEAV